MHDGSKVYVDSYMASNGLWFMVTWTYQEPHLGGRVTQKQRDHTTRDCGVSRHEYDIEVIKDVT